MNLLAKIKMWVGKPQAHPKTGAMQDTSGFTVTVPASLVRLAAPMDVSARAATTIPAKYILLDVVDFTHHRSVEAQTDIVHALNAIVQSSVQCENIPQEKILFLPRGDNIGIVWELSRAPQSSEQFVWLNRRYGETETQLSPSAIMPSTRADSSQNAVI